MVVGLGQPVRVLAKGRDHGERLGDVTARVEETGHRYGEGVGETDQLWAEC